MIGEESVSFLLSSGAWGTACSGKAHNLGATDTDASRWQPRLPSDHLCTWPTVSSGKQWPLQIHQESLEVGFGGEETGEEPRQMGCLKNTDAFARGAPSAPWFEPSHHCLLARSAVLRYVYAFSRASPRQKEGSTTKPRISSVHRQQCLPFGEYTTEFN